MLATAATNDHSGSARLKRWCQGLADSSSSRDKMVTTGPKPKLAGRTCQKCLVKSRHQETVTVAPAMGVRSIESALKTGINSYGKRRSVRQGHRLPPPSPRK